MFLCSTILWFALSFGIGVVHSAVEYKEYIVSTKSGNIEGFIQPVGNTSVNTFLGIPFAEPPVGPRRFQAPVPVARWSGIKKARTLPNTCMQTADTSFERFKGVDMWNPNTNISEDCLYLNIWVPASSVEALTTILWIYGGAFISGTSTLSIYDGAYLAAEKNVIVASMQYRLGVYGFLYSGTGDAPGNMGLLDQQLAMQWIHTNIALFGGDKTRITLMGESAGAGSVSHHLLAKSSWPYFNNAIIQSGSPFAPWASESKTVALWRFKAFAEQVGCNRSDTADTLQCLKAKDVTVLENNQYISWGVQYKPVEGTPFLTDKPTKLVESGEIKKTDIIIGNTKNEGEYFLYYLFSDIFKPENLWQPNPLSRKDYIELVKRLSSDKKGAVTGTLHTYEFSKLPAERGSYRDIIDDILGDTWFKCPVHDFATMYSGPDLSSQEPGKTYVYSFEYRHSVNPWPAWMGVLHGYEIEMMFGLPFNPRLNYSKEDRAVSKAMMDYFVSFAKTGTPNTGRTNSTIWPVFSSDLESHIVFKQDTKIAVRQGFRRPECSYWKNVFPLLNNPEHEVLYSSGNGHDCTCWLMAACLVTLLISALY